MLEYDDEEWDVLDYIIITELEDGCDDHSGCAASLLLLLPQLLPCRQMQAFRLENIKPLGRAR